ncbi:MAG: hypothetical protein ACK449_08715 [Planctomycetota bacterium]
MLGGLAAAVGWVVLGQ